MKKEYSLAHLTAISTTPLELAKIAANCGYDYVSIRQIYMGVTGEVPVDLAENKKMYQEIKDLFKDTGLRLLDIELAKIFDGVDLKKYESAFETGKSLGAKHVLSSIWTDNKDYGIEKFAELCDLAKKYDLTVELEAVPIAGVKSFAEVHIGRTLLYVNSLDKIGVAINQGSFSRAHQVESGYQWTVELKKIEK